MEEAEVVTMKRMEPTVGVAEEEEVLLVKVLAHKEGMAAMGALMVVAVEGLGRVLEKGQEGMVLLIRYLVLLLLTLVEAEVGA